MGASLTHRWHWRKWRPDRWGDPCRVLCRGNGRGPRNILIEFADGERIVAPRFAVRRRA
jgi:hypothetical protein